MRQERHSPQPSPLASLRVGLSQPPPERKLAAAAIFSLSASLLSSPACALVAFASGVLLSYVSGLSMRQWFKAMLPVTLFCALLWVMLPLSTAFTDGDGFSGNAPGAYAKGLGLALLVTLKAFAITSALMALVGSSSVSANGRALLSFRVPQKLVTLILITHCNNMLLYKEFQRIWNAAKLRGFRPRNSLMTYKTCAWMAAILLLRAWNKAKRREEAMKLRGFSGLFPLYAATHEGGGAASGARHGGGIWLLCLFSCALLLLDTGMR